MNTLLIFFLITLVGFVWTFWTIVAYLKTVPKGTVPKSVKPLFSKLALGVIISLISLCYGITQVGLDGFWTFIPYFLIVFPVLFGSLIMWFLTQRKTPLGNIAIQVGDPIIPFTALDSEGGNFSSEEFSGRRILLKFFRGEWCPYCAAELMEFEKMSDQLKNHNITIYALSKDTPERAKFQKQRDGINFSLLSDKNLDVIKAYGVEHHKALGQTKGASKPILGGLRLNIFGQLKFESMAIPTSVLIDENGIVKWIDQADDIRIRSNNERIMSAVKDAFGN